MLRHNAVVAPSLTIVGLGPGDAGLLTIEARDVLAHAPEVWLRTARHATTPGLPEGPRYESFDAVYDEQPSFEEVYATIVERVLELARRPEGVVYAVPGHPLFGEATVRALLSHGREEAFATRVVAGVSFLDVVAPLVELDPLEDGLVVLDALSLGDHRRLLVPERPCVIAQVYDARAATHAKLALLDVYPAEHTVRVVRHAGTAAAAVEEVPLAELDHLASFDHLTALFVPPLTPTQDIRTFEGLRAVIAKLRSPEGGCPWDLQQTHETLKRFLLEEAYEALDALDEGDAHRLAEELGDLLMQVVLHAQVAEDNDEFAIEDVLGSITSKLIRRHPHVFGDVTVRDEHDVIRNWETLKKAERGDAPLLDAVPKALPALAQAQSVQGRAEKANLGPQPPDAAWVAEELRRVSGGEPATVDRLGDVLFAIVHLARERDVDAEEALRGAIRRFRDEVAAAEQSQRSEA